MDFGALPRIFRAFLSIATGCLVLGVFGPAFAQDTERPPNFVIIFLDDSGWADFEPFAVPPYKTPNVARLAAQGCRFQNFYVPQAICSASRSALLSGCYPGRTKVFGAHGPRNRGISISPSWGHQAMCRSRLFTSTFRSGSRPWNNRYRSAGMMLTS